MGIDNRQDTEFFAGRQLVMHKIHCPHIVRPYSFLAVFPELGFDAPLGMLVPELDTRKNLA